MTKDRDSAVGIQWAKDEFAQVDFGDARLNARLIKIADSLSESPESPINQACGSWAESKAAYRFFQNENVEPKQVMRSHAQCTAARSLSEKRFLIIQDTSFISYTDHKKTTGLGILSRKNGTNVKNIYRMGLVMHTAFAVTTEGLPLGILDQKIFAREEISDEVRELKKRTHNTYLRTEEKESYKWLESLLACHEVLEKNAKNSVTICDREADIYDLFELANQKDLSFLVRGNQDRVVNKPSRYVRKQEKLWETIEKSPCIGKINVKVPRHEKTPERQAVLEVRFGRFKMNPPRNHLRHRTEDLDDLDMYAVQVREHTAPDGTEPLQWMLLTNIPVTNFEEAVEKVEWYCLRWRIEIFHKILKSGLQVEKCRLSDGKRLIRYLTIMSIVAWRIFWLTLVARAYPDAPCTMMLEEHEWKVLHKKLHPKEKQLQKPPTVREAIRWIAQLGGFLARKGDGEPGPLALWRGWKRLGDLAEGWNYATS
jgi:hypothetical protein